MLKARDVMADEVRYVYTSDPIVEAAKRILNEGIGSIIVILPEKEPVGIVTKRDIIRAIIFDKLDPFKEPIEKIMTTPLITVDADADLEIVIDTMFKYNISHLPVREGNRIIGMISDYDLVETIRDLLEIMKRKYG